MNESKNLPLGMLLQQLGYITEERMQQALAYQKEHKEQRIGTILVEQEFITEMQMLEALAIRQGCTTIDISKESVDIEAVEKLPKPLAEKYAMLAMRIVDNRLVIALNDPLNYYAIEDVRQLTGMQLDIRLCQLAPLTKAITYYYSEVDARGAAKTANMQVADESIDDLEYSTESDQLDDAPIVRLLDSLVRRAISTNASDVHIEPFEQHSVVRMRIDGVILEYTKLNKALHQPLIARIKILSNLDIAERRVPQDGHFRIAIAKDEYVNIRVSILPTVFGEKAVVRVLDSNAPIAQSSTFGMNQANFNLFRPMLETPNGIIYITGPTGSGKTTTLYMILEYLAKRQVNIATIEDPVERNLTHISQTQVNTQAGLTFENGLRALLRQDPDIIMIGETRDNETASIAVRAAITGHVVFSTLHTNDAVSSVARLADMGVERFLLANSLVGIIAQRLVRKNCDACSTIHEATPAEYARHKVKTIRRGSGCPECNYTGHRGRIAVHEVLSVDTTLRNMISEGANSDKLAEYVLKNRGMRTLQMGGHELLEQGLTTPEELLKLSYYNED